MNGPLILVSWGELLDKMTILEIKLNRLRAESALGHVRTEYDVLRQVTLPMSGVTELAAALLAVNIRLWRIEDLIREKDASGDFGPEFLALARAVYRENDERSRIKQAINTKLRSALVEEKQYSAYERSPG